VSKNARIGEVRLGLAAIWLSDQCGRVGRRLLTIR
jgi:hypothetical protein